MSKARPLLAVLLRLHARDDCLQYIEQALSALREAVRLRVVVQFDRSAKALRHRAGAALSRLGEWCALSALRPLVDETGEHFMEDLAAHWSRARFPTEPDFGVLLEDDEILSPALVSEVAALLRDWPDDLDGTLLASAFPTEDQETNPSIPEHVRHFVWRCQPGLGAGFNASGLMVHAPEHIVLNGKWARLSAPATNVGYRTREERLCSARRAFRSGKVDAHTLALLKEPVNATVPG